MIVLINACQLTSIMQTGNFRMNSHLKSKPYGKFVASDCQGDKCFPGLQQGAWTGSHVSGGEKPWFPVEHMASVSFCFVTHDPKGTWAKSCSLVRTLRSRRKEDTASGSSPPE